MPSGTLRKRLRALPLRFKLTLWNTLVTVLIAVVGLIAVREGLRLMLLKELAVSLEDEAFGLAQSSDGSTGTPEEIFLKMEQAAVGHVRHGWFLQLFGANGELLWNSENAPAVFRRRPYNAESSATDFSGEQYLLAHQEMHFQGAPLYVLRLAAPLEFVQEDVTNVTRIIAPVLLGVFLLAPLGGYILAGRATAPLQKIIATTRQLKPNHLEERLLIRGTGDELDQLSAEINSFLDEIADHLRRNREFVANAAHELRSPLSAMMTSVDVSLSRERSACEYQDLLSMIQDECQQLADLTNQLLLLAESDAGLLDRERDVVQMDRVVALGVEIFAGVAEEKGIVLKADIASGVFVLGQTLQLRQVVNNLLDNAIKFTPPKGHIRVTLQSDAEQKHALLTVQDTGIGVPDKDQVFIFDRFYQVDPTRHHDDVVHGTGLGLSICRAIVEAYGGRISLESCSGMGSKFTVRLPICAEKSRQTNSIRSELLKEDYSRPRST